MKHASPWRRALGMATGAIAALLAACTSTPVSRDTTAVPSGRPPTIDQPPAATLPALRAFVAARGRCRRRSYCVGAEESIRNGLTNVDSR